MEKRYRIFDHYAIAASVGVMLALASYLLSGPRPLHAAAGSAVAATILIAIFEYTCGYARTLVVSDDKITQICLGRTLDVAYRGRVDRIVVEGWFLYSRLSFPGAGSVEVPAYVAERLAKDISAWWEIELEEVQRLWFLPQIEPRH